MTAPTDHLAAARAALDCSYQTSMSAAIDRHLARAQVHATLALAEETRTANLIRSLDYGVAPDMHSRDRLDEITARLWGTPPVPPVSVEDVETLAGVIRAFAATCAEYPIAHTNRLAMDSRADALARRLIATGKVEVRP